MQSSHHGHLKSAGLRIAGFVLLALSAFAASRLYHMAHVAFPHEATLGEMVIAAIAFLSASGGAILLFLGAHIFDTVPISPRWATTRNSGTRNSGRTAIDPSHRSE